MNETLCTALTDFINAAVDARLAETHQNDPETGSIYTGVMKIGASGNDYGYRAGVGALDPLTFDPDGENLTINRLYVDTNGNEAALLLKFNSDLQYGAATTLNVTINNHGPFAAEFSGGAYVVPWTVDLNDLYADLMNLNGANVTVTIN